MALDSLTGIGTMPWFFPQFAGRELCAEYQFSLNKIWEYLDGDTLELCTNRGKFMHLVRLLSVLPEEALRQYSSKKRLVLALWKLYCCEALSRSKRMRLMDILVTQLCTIIAFHLRPVWMRKDALSTFVYDEEIRDLGRQLDWKVLFTPLYERYYCRGYRGPVTISCAKRKATISIIARLASCCRHFWDSEAVGDELQKLVCFELPFDLTQSAVFYQSRIMLLFVGRAFWHKAVLSGDLVKWWAPLSGRTSQSWDATFAAFLYRGIKHGWATGVPVLEACEPLRPFIFQLLASSLLLPVAPQLNITFVKDNVPGEYTPLLPKQLSVYRKLAKIIALLLEPLDGPIVLSHTSTSKGISNNSEVRTTSEAEPGKTVCSTWDYLEALVSVMFPLTHPSHSGKWTGPISQFVATLTLAYTRRVARERMSTAVIHPAAGRVWDGQPIRSYRLGRREDERFTNLFLPLLLQGIYSKSLNASTAYESATKRLCHLVPDLTLSVVLEQVLAALESVTESHQVQSAFRLLSQLCPLVLQRMPELIPDLLNLSLPGIDSGDPFKTVQVLTFYVVLLSQMAAQDYSDVDIQSVPLEDISKRMRRYLFPKQGEASPFISWHNYPPETTRLKREPVRSGSTTFVAAGVLAAESSPASVVTSDTMAEFWNREQIQNRLSSVLIVASVISTWAQDFLAQILRLCSHSVKIEKNAAGVMNSVDRSFGVAMKFCLGLLLTECDEPLYILLCEMYRDWLLNNVFPDATKLAAMVCRTFTQSRPNHALKVLFYPIVNRLLDFTGSNTVTPCPILAGSTEETALRWHMSCFSNLLRCGGDALLPYQKEIVRVIRWAICHPNKNVASLGIKCLRRVVESIYIVTADPGGALGFQDRSAPSEIRVQSALRWGVPWWIDYVNPLNEVGRTCLADGNEDVHNIAKSHVQVEWRMPSAESLHFANYLVALGVRCAEELLHYCIPQPGDLLRRSSHDSNSLEDRKTSLDIFHTIPANSFDFPDIKEFPLELELVSQSPRKLLQRALSLGRHILKALTPLFPDERPNVSPGYPTVSPIAENLSVLVARFLGDLCLTLSRSHLGLCVDAEDVRVDSVPPLVELRGTEDGALTRKLLKAMDQIVARRWCGGGQLAQAALNGKLWTSLGSWISVTSGVHHFSEYQDMLRSTWAERLLNRWMLRVEERRTGHPFTGYRRSILILIARFGTHYYAENRMLAQEILKNAFGHHHGARGKIIRMLCRELQGEVGRLSPQAQLKEAPEPHHQSGNSGLTVPRTRVLSESSPQLTTTDSFSELCPTSDIPPLAHSISKLADRCLGDAELELCYARLTGVTYCLNSAAMLERVWGSSELVKEVLWAVCGCFKAPIARDKLQSRLISLAHGIVSHREQFQRDAEGFTTHIVQGLLADILRSLRGGGCGNWRYQLVATAILASFDPTSTPEIEEDYALWLISACNPATYYPLLNTLALFSLTIYLTPKFSHNAQTSSTSEPSVPDSVASALVSESTVAVICSALVHAHHESSRSTPASYPETAYQLVLDILKMDSTWPTSRFPRHSRHLSVHNCLTVSTCITAQKALHPSKEACKLIELWLTHIQAFLQYPAGETEYHITACEILAGLLNVATSWKAAEWADCWRLLHPQMVTAFHALDQEKFLDFLDALYFAMDETPLRMGSLTSNKRLGIGHIPLVNFLLDMEHPPQVTNIIQNPAPLFRFEDSGKSSLEDTKRLKLILTVIQQAQTTALPLIEQMLPVVPSLLIHPYKQIRHEAAHCLSNILWTLSSSQPYRHSDSIVEQSEQCLRSLSATLGRLADEYRVYLDVHYLDETPRDLGTQRPDPLFGAETLMLMTILLFRYLQDTRVPPCMSLILPVFFEAVKYPDVTLNDIGFVALSCFALRASASEDDALWMKNDVFPNSHHSTLHAFVEILEVQYQAFSWKVRNVVIRLVELLGGRYRLKMHKTDYYRRLVHICVKGLTDTQSEVRDQARHTLSCLAVSLSSQEYIAYTKHFVNLATLPDDRAASSNVNMMGGVLGLTALVHSAPYHIPDWLPATITHLAEYGKSKSPDNVKRQVEKSLQEFLRTHQDAWQQAHVKKFSQSQIDLLDMYKGRPIYFG